MPLYFECPHCSMKQEVEENCFGREVFCQNCGRKVMIARPMAAVTPRSARSFSGVLRNTRFLCGIYDERCRQTADHSAHLRSRQHRHDDLGNRGHLHREKGCEWTSFCTLSGFDTGILFRRQCFFSGRHCCVFFPSTIRNRFTGIRPVCFMRRRGCTASDAGIPGRFICSRMEMWSGVYAKTSCFFPVVFFCWFRSGSRAG